MHLPPSDDAALRELREELERLRVENSTLRAQLVAPSRAAPMQTAQNARGRRWAGRLIQAALLAAGFALGLGYARREMPNAVAGFHDGYRRTAPADQTTPASSARRAP